MLRGSYILVIETPSPQELTIGSLGRLSLAPGFHAYVGSALNGLEHRLRRHLRVNKRNHWHIDYLLCGRSAITEILVGPSEEKTECLLAQFLNKNLRVIPKFGSSDCRCPGHLFFSPDRDHLVTQATEAFRQSGLPFQLWLQSRSSKVA